MKRIPFIYFVLGILSPLPLIIMALFILFYPASIPLPKLMVLFVSYAAVILSFMGGIHWMLAIQKPIVYLQEDDGETSIKRLLLSVVPCIIGEITILAILYNYILTSLIILMLSYYFLLFYEKNSYLPTELPNGYFSVRWIITCLMETCFIGVFIARLI